MNFEERLERDALPKGVNPTKPFRVTDSIGTKLKDYGYVNYTTGTTRCWNPLNIKTKTGVTTLAPCGQCAHCRIRRMWELASRIDLEYLYWDQNLKQSHLTSMWTLTYENQPLTKSGRPTLNPKHLVDFWKRLRNAGYKFRYFVAGEYGPKTQRPHYHAHLFGIDWFNPQTAADVEHIWGHGYVDSGKGYLASTSGGRYTSGYVLKKLRGKLLDNEKSQCPDWVPEFHRSSKKPAIGVPYIDFLAKDLLSEPRVTQNAWLAKWKEDGCTLNMGKRKLRLDRFLKDRFANAIGKPDFFRESEDESRFRYEDFLNDATYLEAIERNRAKYARKIENYETKKTI